MPIRTAAGVYMIWTGSLTMPSASRKLLTTPVRCRITIQE